MIYIQNEHTNPFFNHALEEYILLNFEEEAFILWRNQKSILIGRNQNTLSEIHGEFVSTHGIDVVRRLSGGGTVFCDLGNINFTFITNKKMGNEGFEKFAMPVIDALQTLGIPAEFSGRNDITINGLKISGNAQYHTKTRLLHHGTILYAGNLAELSGALKSKPLKFVDKSIKSVASRVTNIVNYLEKPMDVLEFKAYLKKYIMASNGIAQEYILTEKDLEQINQIMQDRFMSWDWNYGASPKYTFVNAVKYKSGMVEYSLKVEAGIIKNAVIHGDFFGECAIDELCALVIGVKHNQEELLYALREVDVQNYIAGISLEEFVEGLLAADEVKPMASEVIPTESERKSTASEVKSTESERKQAPSERKPDWLRVKMQGGKEMSQVKGLITELSLNTVCVEANCPNRMECYNKKTATFMILGRNCTRNCTFCNVTKAAPDPLDLEEPRKVAEAIHKLGILHAVITSVTRDDLEDQGANQFAEVVTEIRKIDSSVKIELLIPDMQGRSDLINIILESQPDILNHNIETVPSLYSLVRPMASFERSLQVLGYVKEKFPKMKTKSGVMLGLGESKEEVIEVMKRLRGVDCDILTLGQYLQPSKSHIAVVEYIHPSLFDEYKEIALSLGFKSVASAPLVRSSYHAAELDFE